MDAAAYLAQKRVVLAAGRTRFPSVADFVAGEPVRGGWWSHPKGHAIFATLEALEASGEVRFCKLIGGRVTLVHASLWPAVIRLAGDAERIRSARRGLPETAERLYTAVVRARARGVESAREGRVELEKPLLVHTEEKHTETGRHAAVLRAWRYVGDTKERRAADALSFDDAVDEVTSAIVQAAGNLPRRDLQGCLPVTAEVLNHSLERLADGNRIAVSSAKGGDVRALNASKR